MANDDLRSFQARIAALTRASQEDGSEMTRPARAAFLAGFQTGHRCKYCKPITIDPGLPDDQRARAVAALISLHFSRLARASAKTRQRARAAALAAAAAETDRELAEDLAQLDAG